MKSLKELFRIGKGPSSSHTMGPQMAAKIFLERNKKAKEYRKYNLKDMIDLINDKEEVETVKYYETDTTEGNLELQQISQEQVQSTPSSDVCEQYDRHTSEVNSDDEPYFGDAYEALPIEAFGLDDFEEK